MSQDGDANARNRRGSISQAALSNLFQRGSSGANGQSFSGQQGQGQAPMVNDPQRRRLSVSTLGLSGAPATNPGLGIRRSSVSTNSNNSDAIDESAIEDDDYGTSARTAPTTPFTRHMSFGTSMRSYRPGGSPGNDQQGFNWSEQLRTRAESSFSQGTAPRPSFSFGGAGGSPPRNAPLQHDRAKSVSDMPQPPVQAEAMKPKVDRPKPDAFQERILKGDFYMD